MKHESDQNRNPRYVYLLELDSVRNSEPEIEAGLAALTRTLMDPDACVVLTYNQIGDGSAMLRCFADESSRAHFVEMFRRGRIRISRYSLYGGLVAYIDEAFKKNIDAQDTRKGYIFSSLPFLKKAWYSSGSAEAKDRLGLLFEKMRSALQNNDYSALDSPKAAELFASPEDQRAASSYIKSILDISVSAGLYVESKPSGQSKSLKEVLLIATGVMRETRPETLGVCQALESAIDQAENPNARSSLYAWLEVNCGDEKLERQCKRVIDLAYNFTCMDSIDVPGLSYDENDFPGRLKALIDNGFENG